MLTPLVSYLAARAARNELSQVTERELQDLALSRDQLQRLIAMPADVKDRVSAMAEVFGLPSERLQEDKAVWTELLETCSACRDLSACRKLLNRNGAAQPQDAGFCANRPSFAQQAAKVSPATSPKA